MRRRHFFRSTLVAALMMPLSASADEASDKAAIRALWESYAAHRVAGDTDQWLGLWDENGIQMPPGMPARSIESLRPKLPDAWAASPRDAMEIAPEEIVVTDGWAYTRGTYTADAADSHFEGKFMTILRRQNDGTWRIYRDIFNPNG